MRTHICPGLLAGILVLAGTPAQEETPLLVETLPNGLEVVIEENHAVPIVDVRAYMRIGSMYEGEYLGCGLSHYMEHIVSGGSTRDRTEAENRTLLRSIGGRSNASTYYNYTQYYITTRSEMLHQALDLLSGYLMHCTFDPGEVEREQRVVQQELLRNLDDPGRVLGRLFTETMFRVHPVRVPVIGYQDCIQRLTREDMLRFYQRHYTPQNCVLGIVGDVNRTEALALARQYFGSWERKPLAPYQIPAEPPQTSRRQVERQHGATSTCRVVMGVRTVPFNHPDMHALDMLAFVLGLGESSLLPALFEHDASREVLATGVGASSWTPVFGAGRLSVGFQVDTPENARRLLEEVWQEMTRLREELVSQEQLQRALRTLEKYHYMGRATVDDRCRQLVSSQAWVHDARSGDRYMEEIAAVTPEEVREAARRYLQEDQLTVALLTPIAEAEEAASGTRVEEVGQVREVHLENGLTLLIKRLPGHGLVDLSAAFHGGVIHESPELSGVFNLMASTFWRGTQQMDSRALLQAMDELGMELVSESHNNVVQLRVKAVASRFEPSWQLFTQVLLEPALDPRWVERYRELLLERVLPGLEVNSRERGQRILREALYTNHPYRRQRLGTPETVARLTAEQVGQTYKTYLRPGSCVLAIYGDVDPDRVEELVRTSLAGWEPRELPASQVVEDAGPLESRTIELTHQQVRTRYLLGWRALSREQEREGWALSVMNVIMGGGGWLHQRLREGDRHYVYAVGARNYRGDGAGHFWIETDFTPADEAEVLAIIDGVVADMRAGRFTDEELEVARSAILCYEALGQRENENVCQGDALAELLGHGWDYDPVHFEGIRNVTREDVIQVANLIFGQPSVRILIRPAEAGSR